MSRKGMYSITALAAAALAITCGLGNAGSAHAASDFTLLTLPDQGESAIYSFVNSATSSVDMTIYEIKDTTLVNDLIARENAGVTVRVIMDEQHKSYDAAAYSALTAAGSALSGRPRPSPTPTRRRSPSMTVSLTSAEVVQRRADPLASDRHSGLGQPHFWPARGPVPAGCRDAPDPADRRRNAITLTTEGSRHLKHLDALIADAEAEFLGPLPEADRAELIRILKLVVGHHSRSLGAGRPQAHEPPSALP